MRPKEHLQTNCDEAEPLFQSAFDHFAALSDVLPRVFEDLAADVLELVAALRVASSFGGGAVSQPPRDFDHNTYFLEQEVDASDVSAALSMDRLSDWSRDTGLTDELEEPPLEHGVPAGIHEQVVNQAAPPTS